MDDLRIVADYLKERIRIDSITDGFLKGYHQKLILQKNTEVLMALSRLESQQSDGLD